jgi:hypothetical protein
MTMTIRLTADNFNGSRDFFDYRDMRIGDLLTFKALTRYSFRKATRKITGFDHYGRPLVRYAGWTNFIVQPEEIISVERLA